MEEKIFDLVNDFESFEESFEEADEVVSEFVENVDLESENEVESVQTEETLNEENNSFMENEISGEDCFSENEGVEEDNNLQEYEENEITDEDNRAFWENDQENFEEPIQTLGGIGDVVASGFFGALQGLFNANQFVTENDINPQNIEGSYWGAAAATGALMEILLGASDQAIDCNDVPFSDIIANFSDLYENVDFEDIFSQLIQQDIITEYLSADDFTNCSDYIETDDNFHFQECQNSCAIATITDIANDFGFDVSEAQLRDIAANEGIYDEASGGTAINALGDFIQNLTGHETHSGSFNDINDLVDALNNGNKVILAVDPLELSNTPAGIANMIQEELSGTEIASQGHAVELKGVQFFDGEPYGVIDDPACGHNIMHPLDQLLDACADFNNFAVIVEE